jgi:hypothetical protein
MLFGGASVDNIPVREICRTTENHITYGLVACHLVRWKKGVMKELYNNAPTAYVHVYFTPKCSNSVVQNGLNQELLLENLVSIETLPRSPWTTLN